MSFHSAAVLGGDLRQRYLAEYMHKLGYAVTCFGVAPLPAAEASPPRPEDPGISVSTAHSLKEALRDARLVICPMPFSRDNSCLAAWPLPDRPIFLEQLKNTLEPGQLLIGGGIPKAFAASCFRKQVPVIELMEDEALAQANAGLTAEGLLASLISNTPFSLAGQKLLLLGYGRCGQKIGTLLRCFSMQISVFDQKPERLAQARKRNMAVWKPEAFASCPMDFDLIVNTIPAQLLTSLSLARLPKHCILFDIASAPFGFQPEAVKALGLKLVRCPGIPGVMTPQTAGEMIGKTISERMLSHGL